MASVKRRPSGAWRARYRDPSGRERAKHFARKIDAERFLATVTADMARGVYVTDSTVTVSEYARKWLACRPHGPRTAERVESIVRLHITETSLGDRRLAAVAPSEVQAWASGRAAVLAPATTRKVVGVLRSIYGAAVLDRLAGSSPVVNVSLPPAHRERVVPLTVLNVWRLAGAMQPRYRALVLVQAGLGLRVAELLALRVQDVSFLGRRSVTIAGQLSRSGELIPPKTPTSRRVIPLPAVVAEVLAAHIGSFPPSADGRLWPVTYRSYARAVGRAAAAVGLPAGTSSHDLRHHYASVLLAAGESVVAVAERLGHGNASLVLSTYGHLMPDSEETTRKAIDGAWSAANADSERTGRSSS